MKTAKLFYLVLLCAVLPTAAQAQKNLIKAIDDFVSDDKVAEYVKVNSSVEKNGEGDETVSYIYQYRFEMSATLLGKLDRVIEAFERDTDEAYNVLARDEGISNNVLVNVSYGKDLDKSISYGSYLDRNYRIMLVRDKQDTLKRYCYAVTWHVDKENNMLAGSLDKIYGQDPQKPRGLNDGFSVSIGLDGSLKSGYDALRRFSLLRSAYKSALKEHADLALRSGLANKIIELCKEAKKLKLSENEKVILYRGVKDLEAITADEYLKDLLKLARLELY